MAKAALPDCDAKHIRDAPAGGTPYPNLSHWYAPEGNRERRDRGEMQNVRKEEKKGKKNAF